MAAVKILPREILDKLLKWHWSRYQWDSLACAKGENIETYVADTAGWSARLDIQRLVVQQGDRRSVFSAMADPNRVELFKTVQRKFIQKTEPNWDEMP